MLTSEEPVPDSSQGRMPTPTNLRTPIQRQPRDYPNRNDSPCLDPKSNGRLNPSNGDDCPETIAAQSEENLSAVPDSGDLIDDVMAQEQNFETGELKLIDLNEALQEVSASMVFEHIFGEDQLDAAAMEDHRKQVATYISQLKMRSDLALSSPFAENIERSTMIRPPTKAHVEADQLNETTDLQIIKGMDKIRELDVILREKTAIAQSLKRQREASAKSAVVISENHSRPHSPSASVKSDISRSHSSLNTSEKSSRSKQFVNRRSSRSHSQNGSHLGPHPEAKTFITETRVSNKALSEAKGMDEHACNVSGQDALVWEIPENGTKGESGDAQTSTKRRKRNLRRDDFVVRNILLGSEARYYSAMTDDERTRVNQIMLDFDAENGEEIEAIPTESIERIPSMKEMEGYVPVESELMRLAMIEDNLRNLVPRSEWPNKLLSETSTGISTPFIDSDIPMRDFSETKDKGESRSFPKHGGRLVWSGTERSEMSISSKDLETLLKTGESQPDDVLKTTRITREERKRLHDIDRRLLELKQLEDERGGESQFETDEVGSCISREQLDRLLDMARGQ